MYEDIMYDSSDGDETEEGSEFEMIDSDGDDQIEGESSFQVMPSFDMRELEENEQYAVWSETTLLSWFEEELVKPLENVRTKNGIKPKCPALTRMILVAFNLDVEKVYSLFIDSKEEREIVLQKTIGFKEPKKEYPLVIVDEHELCGTCYCDDDQLYSTGCCEHLLCIDCFEVHYRTEVEKGALSIKCYGGPENDCKQVYNDDVLDMLAENVEMSVSINKVRRNTVIEAAKKSKYNWFVLPCTRTVNCQYYFQINKSILDNIYPVSTTLKCKCGATYCAKHLLKDQKVIDGEIDCDEEEGHEPLSCWHVKFFDKFVPKEEIRRKKVKDTDENRKFMEAHTRPCPKCKTNVWRDGGCKHLSCRCGAYFCWHCKYEYRHDHDEHICSDFPPQIGNFDENVAEFEERISDENKPRFDKTKELIRLNSFDLAVLAYRFKGQDPELIWKVMKDHNLDESAELDSGVDEPISDDVKIWDQVSDEIKRQVSYEFTFPVHFLSNDNFKSEQLTRENQHLFDIIVNLINSSLIRIKMVTRTVESLHRFNFMLKVGTSPIVDVLIDELQEQLDLSRNLGTSLAKELVKIQDPDFKNFEDLNNDKGQKLESMASEWSTASHKLENIASETLKSVKANRDLTFWKADPTHGPGEQIFKRKDEPDNEKTEQNEREKHEEPEFQQYGLIPGTDIMWDFLHDEPVDMVTYDIND